MTRRTSRIRTAFAGPLAAAFLALFVALAGCNTSDMERSGPGDRAKESGDETETRESSIGASTQAYSYDDDGERPIPSYNERLSRHLLNRFRLDPEKYGIETMQGPVPPQLPLIGDASLVEAGRWQARHVLSQSANEDGEGAEGSCLCPQFQPRPEMMGQGACCLSDDADVACEIRTEDQCQGEDVRFAPGADCGAAGCPLFDRKNSCCPMTRDKGEVRCTKYPAPITCDDKENATDEPRRWKLLETGSASIVNELYQRQVLPSDSGLSEIPGELAACWAVGGCSAPTVRLLPPQPFLGRRVSAMGVAQSSEPQVPDKCKPPEDTCDVGTCTSTETGENTCTEADQPNCTGQCEGEACDGVCREENEDGEKIPVQCDLPTSPDPEECQPSEYPHKHYISYVHGNTQEPIPTLIDGIHYRLGLFAGVFDATSEGETGFGIHYYEPAGEAQAAQVVVEGTCESLSIEKRNITQDTSASTGHLDGGIIGPDATTSDTSTFDSAIVDSSPSDSSTRDSSATDSSTPDSSTTDSSTGDSSTTDSSTRDSSTTDSSTTDGGDTVSSDGGTDVESDTSDAGGGATNYWGLRYGTEVDLDTGCHRYVFSFTDAVGFIHTYPRYGSLGAKIAELQTDDGTMKAPVANDENCPVWSPDRPSMSCLPEGDECVSGETRRCYTGRDNTRGKGICELGTEQCENGRWSGVCNGEVTPKSEESCGDDKDNDCNGFVDENCGSDGDGDDTGTDSDTGMSTDDTGTMEDVGPSPDGDGTSGDAGVDGGDAGTGGATREGCGCSASSEGTPLAPALFFVAVGILGLRMRRGRGDRQC